MNLKQHLDYLFNPRSVAVIGASNGVRYFRSTPEMGAKVLAYLVRYSEYMGILKGNR